jgi:hypothetical protein
MTKARQRPGFSIEVSLTGLSAESFTEGLTGNSRKKHERAPV